MLLWYILALVLPVILLFIPWKGARSYRFTPPHSRMHEADAVLSRRRLLPGTPEYEDYYLKKPQFKEADDRARNSPGLLSPESKYYDPFTFAASQANFKLIDHLSLLIDDALEKAAPAPTTQNEPPRQGGNDTKNAAFVQKWLQQSGAHSVGFTTLRDYHLYTHKGRGPRSGQPITGTHGHAIALTVEMAHDMIQPAPRGTSVMESSEQYLRSGVLALKLAAWIRELGYEAQAHIDGNYELICPLVAVDAGLGVIGRMGLLMTPRLGPRVRIAVVTTNMPFPQDPTRIERSTLHFCDLCKKCAVNCPAAAIPQDSQKEIDGVQRWQIHSEPCYQFWTTSGTDCGRCMSVCPYAHRANAFHRFIRWGIKNNLLFRHLAVKLDDVFYGRKPQIRPLPSWAGSRERP